jgi:hypothetical protein
MSFDPNLLSSNLGEALVKKHIIRVNSTRWTIFRWTKMAVMILGTRVPFPIQSDDQDLMYQFNALSSNLSQVCLILGLLLIMVHPESSYRAIITYLILASC